MIDNDTDCVVIGAGVVGLAVGRRLAQQGRDVVVIERESHIGAGTSSRNSEVVHAGIYYPANSLKARLCVAGRRALYEYCDSHNVPVKKTGKYIVATSEDQLERLESLLRAGLINGVEGLKIVSSATALADQPNLACVGALFSPQTGIVDSHGFMLALQGGAEEAGAVIAFNTMVESIVQTENGFSVQTGDDGYAITCSTIINAAGHGAVVLANTIDGICADAVPRAYLAKGNYFRLAAPAPFTRLIYPVPEPGGLGVHITVDLGGQARFGPDVEWIDAPHFEVDGTRADSFYAEIRKYWPGLPDGSLLPDYAGIRPKISRPGEPAADFVISGEQDHGLPGLVNLFGIESPGLTSALAIADEVVGKV